jgi:hypothetical protein
MGTYRSRTWRPRMIGLHAVEGQARVRHGRTDGPAGEAFAASQGGALGAGPGGALAVGTVSGPQPDFRGQIFTGGSLAAHRPDSAARSSPGDP